MVYIFNLFYPFRIFFKCLFDQEVLYGFLFLELPDFPALDLCPFARCVQLAFNSKNG